MTDKTNRTSASRGPFPASQDRERLWEDPEPQSGPYAIRGDGTGAGPSARRGAEGESERRHWGRRESDGSPTRRRTRKGSSSTGLATRFRKPLIGLALAGVAAPMVNAGVVTPEAPKTDDAERAEESADTPVAADRDLEEEVGDYWAEAEEAEVRLHTIAGAVTRWDIDEDLAEKIYDYATKHELEPDMAYGLVFTESSFRERAVSHVGARGLTQLMPRTARWLDPAVSSRDLYDADVNLDLGFRYLRQLIDKYDGDVESALTAYNRGPGTVDRILRGGGNPDNGYAAKVLAG
jgi:hypothetical protein